MKRGFLPSIFLLVLAIVFILLLSISLYFEFTSTDVPVPPEEEMPLDIPNVVADNETNLEIPENETFQDDDPEENTTDDDEEHLELTECNDNLDNDLDGLIDLSDPGCADAGDTDESNEVIFCPYGNTITEYATCDYRYTVQNDYSSLPVETYGVSRRAWTIGAGQLKAAPEETLDSMLAYTEKEINATFSAYLKNNKDKINPTDLFILDIEDELDAELIGNHSDNITLQTQMIEAIKRRIHVVRVALPNAKLALWNTILPISSGKTNDKLTERMNGYRAAADQGMFNELDYMLPNLYTRFGPLDTNYEQYTLDATRMALEYSSTITRPDGSTIPLAAMLSFHIGNGGSDNKNQPVDRALARKQVELIQTYPAVEVILWWSGSDTWQPGDYDLNITGYYEDVKAVPSACFCG